MSFAERDAQIGQHSLKHFLGRLLTMEPDYLIADIVGLDDGIEQRLILGSLAQEEQSLLTSLDREPARQLKLRNKRSRESPASTQTFRR